MNADYKQGMIQLTDKQIEEGYLTCSECEIVGNVLTHNPIGLCGGLDGFDDSYILEDDDGTPLGRYNQLFTDDDFLCDNCISVVGKRRANE